MDLSALAPDWNKERLWIHRVSGGNQAFAPDLNYTLTNTSHGSGWHGPLKDYFPLRKVSVHFHLTSSSGCMWFSTDRGVLAFEASRLNLRPSDPTSRPSPGSRGKGHPGRRGSPLGRLAAVKMCQDGLSWNPHVLTVAQRRCSSPPRLSCVLEWFLLFPPKASRTSCPPPEASTPPSTPPPPVPSKPRRQSGCGRSSGI